MNTTPNGERTRIVLLGRCNAGKSSLVNAISEQRVAITSSVKGTTTDPVHKAMEILPIGPVLFCDTPGLDDTSELGSERMKRTLDELRNADLALVVTDGAIGIGECEREVIDRVKATKIPYVVVFNKIDVIAAPEKSDVPFIPVSAATGAGIDELKAAMIKALPETDSGIRLAADLVKPGDVVILVTPIDSAAPKGRLILPQQQVTRDLLEAGALPLVTRETELEKALAALSRPPALVITDSQAFRVVSEILPADIPLTSFSILFARYKGDIDALVAGANAIASLKDGDRILVAEGCTHHRQGDDIGTVKIPNLLRKKTGKNLVFEHSSGIRYPENLSEFALVIHCGGCMLGRREMLYRIGAAKTAGVPIVNYGVALACLNGILTRSLAPISNVRHS